MKVVAEAEGFRLVYSLSYGPTGAVATRRRMDANRDGRVSAAESGAEAARLGRRIATDMVVEVDGDRVPIEWSSRFVGPAIGGVDPSPLTIELGTTLPLGPGEHTVSLMDVGLDEIERSDYGFDASAPAVLVASGSGASPGSVERLVSFLERSEAPERRVTARFRLPGSASPPWLIWAGVAALVIAAAVGLVVRRRLSARRTGT